MLILQVITAQFSYSQQLNVTYSGNIISTQYLNTVTECQTRCSLDYTCSGVTWKNNQFGECFLRSFLTGIVNNSPYDTYKKSYTPKTNTFTNGFDYPSYDIESFILDTPGLCYQACDADNSCAIAVYNSVYQVCWLKYSIGIAVATPNFMAYFKSSDTPSYVLFDNLNDVYDGNTLITTRVNDRNECMLSCTNTPSCQAVVYSSQVAVVWTQLTGRLNQLSVSENTLCGNNDNGQVFCSVLLSSDYSNSWAYFGDYSLVTSISGTRVCVANYGSQLWCNDNWAIGFNWYELPGLGITVSLSGNRICHTNSANMLWCSYYSSINWIQISGSWLEVSLDGNNVCTINATYAVFCATDNVNPLWKEVTVMPLVKLDLSGNILCGVDFNDNIYCSNFMIRNWKQIQGKGMNIAINGTTLHAVNRERYIYSTSLSFMNNANAYQLNPSFGKICTLKSGLSLKNLTKSNGTNVYIKSNYVKSQQTTILTSKSTTAFKTTTVTPETTSNMIFTTTAVDLEATPSTLSTATSIVTTTFTFVKVQSCNITNSGASPLVLHTNYSQLYQNSQTAIEITATMNSINEQPLQLFQVTKTIAIINWVFKCAISIVLVILVLIFTPTMASRNTLSRSKVGY